MIIILGESASGKSTLQNMLIEHDPKYHKLITYTTRPMRESEKDGVDYHFIHKLTFNELSNNNFFFETAIYREWFYGTAIDDIKDKNSVAVVTPSGFRKMKKSGIDIISIYLCVDRESRLIQSIRRGDNIDEAYRRNLSDSGQFDGISEEVDYVIDNKYYHKNKEQILQELMGIIRKEGDDNIR